jgi:hypothetical protein
VIDDETLGLLPEAHSIRQQAERRSGLDRDLQRFIDEIKQPPAAGSQARSLLGYGPRAPSVDFSGTLRKRDTFQRSSKAVALRSVRCHSIGIQCAQRSEELSTWGRIRKSDWRRPRLP